MVGFFWMGLVQIAGDRCLNFISMSHSRGGRGFGLAFCCCVEVKLLFLVLTLVLVVSFCIGFWW